MSNHSKVIVPIESWSYNSPGLLLKGHTVDIGLLMEALIYYDEILINITTPGQLAELLNWFIKNNKYDIFLNLINENVIKFFHFDFITAAIEKNGIYMIWNIQTTEQQVYDTFENSILYSNDINKIIKHSRLRKKLFDAFANKIKHVKSSDFGPPIENARLDYQDSDRSALLVQSFLDEVYPKFNLGKTPRVKTEILKLGENKYLTKFNINFTQISQLLENKVPFNEGTPLTAAAHCNRLIWAAIWENCDIYLGQPMATLVGDKLFESSVRITRKNEIISSLNNEVEFPDVSNLINQNKLKFEDILLIRKNAKKFRTWLQIEGERDRNAIIAYHNEVAIESGFTKISRKSLNLFGTIGGPLLTAYLSKEVNPTIGIAGGAALKFLTDIVSKLQTNWKPVIFGKWLEENISKIIIRKNLSN